MVTELQNNGITEGQGKSNIAPLFQSWAIIKGNRVATRFPYYDLMRTICCPGNQSSDPIWPKAYSRLSPTPMMLQVNLVAIDPLVAEIFMFEQTQRHRLDGYTISSPCELQILDEFEIQILGRMSTS